MLTAYEVLTALGSVLLALLLLADVRDELMRGLKPIILRYLESAGVLTREDYLHRSGLSDHQLTAIKQATTAAAAFTSQVVQQQQQQQQQHRHHAPATVVPSGPAPVTMPAPSHRTPSPVASPSAPPSPAMVQKRRASTMRPAVSSSVIHAKHTEVHNLSPVVTLASATESPSPSEPAPLQLAAALEEAMAANPEAFDDATRVSRPASRSRKQKSDSRESKEAVVVSPGVAAVASAVSVAAAPAPAQPAGHLTSPVSITVPATPHDQARHLSPLVTSQPDPHHAHPDHHHDHHEVSGNGTLASYASAPAAMQPVPIIAGYPLTALTIVRSMDDVNGVSIEEYFNASGEKVAWRRGQIFDSDFIFTLATGIELMKFGSWGAAHVRHVKFTLDPLSQQVRLDWGTGSILLDDITEIRSGKTTPVFKRSRYSNDPDVTENACFSIITPKRTLDLSILMRKTQQRVKEKRDLLVFGLSEITGTRVGATTDVPGEKKLNGRRNSLLANGGGPIEIGMGSLPIPYRKIHEAIQGKQRGAGFTPGVLTNSILLGANGSQVREEYSLSTQQSHAQPSSAYSSVPNTPSAAYRSAHGTPMQPRTANQLAPPMGAPRNGTNGTTPHQQQLTGQGHRLPQYPSAPALAHLRVAPELHEPYTALPPPHFSQQMRT